jgi:hypothetical protein
VLTLFIRHPRADIYHALFTVRFLFKIILVTSLTASAVVFLPGTAGPVPRHRRLRVLLIAPVLLAAGILVELVAVPTHAWAVNLMGHNAAQCLALIPLISIPTLACLLVALRSGAPLQPGLAGAAAGLVSGGIAATVYALTCPDDNPLFIAAWYSLAIAIITAASACVASRLLRW